MGNGRIIEHTANREKQEECSQGKRVVVGEAAGEPEHLSVLDVSKSGQCLRQGLLCRVVGHILERNVRVAGYSELLQQREN